MHKVEKMQENNAVGVHGQKDCPSSRKSLNLSHAFVYANTSIYSCYKTSSANKSETPDFNHKKIRSFIHLTVAIIFLLNAALCLGSASEPSDSILLQSFVSNNCGLNSVLTLASFFGVSEQIATSDVHRTFGERLHLAASVFEIKELLSNLGLYVDAFKNVSPLSICKLVDSKNAVICSLKSEINHFVVILPSHNGKTYRLLDFPRNQVELSRERLIQFLAKYSAGIVITGSNMKVELVANQSSDPMYSMVQDVHIPKQIPSKIISPADGSIQYPEVIDVAIAGLANDSVEVPVKIFNTSDNKIRLSDPQGECGCFLGINGSLELEPKKFSILGFKFNEKQLVESKQVRVILKSNQLKDSNQLFTFRVLNDYPGKIFQIKKFVRLVCDGISPEEGSATLSIGSSGLDANSAKILSADISDSVTAFNVMPPAEIAVAGKKMHIANIVCKVRVQEPGINGAIQVIINTNNPSDKRVSFYVFRD